MNDDEAYQMELEGELLSQREWQALAALDPEYAQWLESLETDDAKRTD